jgi:hypothetical protein
VNHDIVEILPSLIVILGKVSVREISTVVVARACLWKCEKFEFADRLHWRRQASRGHEYLLPTLDVYCEIFSRGMRFVGTKTQILSGPDREAMTLL